LGVGGVGAGFGVVVGDLGAEGRIGVGLGGSGAVSVGMGVAVAVAVVGGLGAGGCVGVGVCVGGVGLGRDGTGGFGVGFGTAVADGLGTGSCVAGGFGFGPDEGAVAVLWGVGCGRLLGGADCRGRVVAVGLGLGVRVDVGRVTSDGVGRGASWSGVTNTQMPTPMPPATSTAAPPAIHGARRGERR
jgi:hypothetical protein